MLFTNRASFATIRSAAHTSIGAAYATIGSSLAEPAVCIAFINNTDGDVFVSIDGTNDHLLLPTNTSQIFNVRSNSPSMSDLTFRVGTQFYVKDGPDAPASGTFYIEVLQVTS